MIEKLIKQFKSFIILVIILIVWLGLYSFKNMPKESAPSIDIPFFVITSIYPGADAKSVEEQVTKKIEDKLPSVNHISTYNSISADNVSSVTVQFQKWADKNTAYNDLKSALDNVKNDLPSNVKISFKSTDIVSIPVYSFSVEWNLYPSIMYDKIRFLEDDLKKISWVDSVTVIWSYVPVVKVNFDYDKLKKYNFTTKQLVGIINTSISKIPVDKKQINDLLYSFEVRTYLNDLEWCRNDVEWWKGLIWKLECFKQQLLNIPLLNKQWNILRLKDVANVDISHPFYKKESFIDGKTAITYIVYKTSWTDILDLVARIKSYLKTKDNFFKQNDLDVVEISSQTIDVNKTFETFISNFWQTTLIILLVIGLFVGLKEAFSVFLAFPLVYLITFIFLNAIWYTFNSIVSFSLILTLWIMVDNLIVIIEWVDEALKKWMTKYEAISYSLKTYRKAILAWNLTTIAMFFPLNFMLSGRIGEFMKALPTTIDATLIFSMIVAFVFLPVIITFFKFKRKKNETNDTQVLKKEKLNIYEKIYLKLLKYPKTTIFSFWLIFIVSTIAFVKLGSVNFLPATDKNNIYVNIKYDKSFSLPENKQYTQKVYNYTKDFFDKYYPWIVKNMEITVWDYQTTQPLDRVIYNNSFNPDLAKINIRLTDTDDRNSYQDAVKIYPKLNNYLHSKLWEFDWKIKEINAFINKNGPSAWKDVGFNISISSWDKANIITLANNYQKLLPELKKIPWTYGWSSSLEYSNWKIQILYDLNKIKLFNLDISDINTFLLGLYDKTQNYQWWGINISSLSDFWKDIIPVKVYIIAQNSQKLDYSHLLIPWTNIYVSQVVKSIKIKPDVKYYKHLDGTLVVNIQAYKEPNITLWNITKQIDTIVKKFPKIKLTYAADVKDMKQSMKDLAFAFLVWIFLMFAVLVLNFGNYKYPLIVFSIIPLLFIWAFWLLIVFHLPFGFPAQLWMFGLIWVGVNDAILLIERYNDLQQQIKWKVKSEKWKVNNENVCHSCESRNLPNKKELKIENWKFNNKKWDYKLVSEWYNPEILLKSWNLDTLFLEVATSRLKPVFLTTLTTVLWLITLAIKDDLWGSLALAFMGGLIVWTFINLVYIPFMLKVVDRK